MKKWVVFTSVVFAIVAGVVTYAQLHKNKRHSTESSSSAMISPETISANTALSDEDMLKKLPKDVQEAINLVKRSPDERHVLIVSFTIKDKITGDPEQIKLFVDTLNEFDLTIAEDQSFDKWDIVLYSAAALARAWAQAGPYPSLEQACIEGASRILTTQNNDAEFAKIQALSLLDMVRRTRPDHTLPPSAEKVYQNTLKNGYLKKELSVQIEKVLKPATEKVGRTFPGE